MPLQMQDWEVLMLMGLITAFNGGKIAVPVRFQGQTTGLDVVFRYNPSTGHVDILPGPSNIPTSTSPIGPVP